MIHYVSHPQLFIFLPYLQFVFFPQRSFSFSSRWLHEPSCRLSFNVLLSLTIFVHSFNDTSCI